MFIGLLPLFGPLGSGGFINPLDTITISGLISSIVSFAEIGFFVCPDSLTALGLLRPASTLLRSGFLPHNGTIKENGILTSTDSFKSPWFPGFT